MRLIVFSGVQPTVQIDVSKRLRATFDDSQFQIVKVFLKIAIKSTLSHPL